MSLQPSDILVGRLTPTTIEQRRPSQAATSEIKEESLRATIVALRKIEEAVDTLNRSVGDPRQSAITIEDMDVVLDLFGRFILSGASGSFTAQSGETVTVENGIITSIV